MTEIDTGRTTEAMSPDARKAVFGAWFGFVVDMFDVYLPIVALAPAMAYFEPKGLSPGAAAVIAAAIFTATLIGRPVGAIVFGHFADRIGRRRTAIVSVLGFGVTTLVIACLPGHQAWGVWAIVALIALRFVDGVFLGGEYTSATPLALEYSPRRRRGIVGGFIVSGYPLAYCLVAIITYLLLRVLPANGPDSPYVQWGWRIPFVIGALLAFVFVAWFVRSVRESESWAGSEKARRPLVDLFTGSNLRGLAQVFVLMTGVWLTLNMMSAVLPGLLTSALGLTSSTTTGLLIIVYAVLVGAYAGGGALSQHTGRRRYLMGSGVLIATLVPVGYGVIVSGSVGSLVGLAVLLIVVNILALSMWGAVTPYINERFATSVRASGFGVGYSLAVIVPSFYAFYQNGLAAFVPPRYTALVLLVLAGLLVFTGAAIGPETRDVRMGASGHAGPNA
ncbi:MFS transporter [Pseudonocardia acaciae]|uniref:MFS transporter n=1 Tax=Pseudonocardia acaciae TaxID=551276 RepID=UPI0004918DAC|nr:MFS transporter [Pseudonocardia acaciae]